MLCVRLPYSENESEQDRESRLLAARVELEKLKKRVYLSMS